MTISDDAAAADAAVDAIWRRSWIGGRLASLACRLRAAWTESTCRRLLRAAGVGR